MKFVALTHHESFHKKKKNTKRKTAWSWALLDAALDLRTSRHSPLKTAADAVMAGVTAYCTV